MAAIPIQIQGFLQDGELILVRPSPTGTGHRTVKNGQKALNMKKSQLYEILHELAIHLPQQSQITKHEMVNLIKDQLYP